MARSEPGTPLAPARPADPGHQGTFLLVDAPMSYSPHNGLNRGVRRGKTRS